MKSAFIVIFCVFSTIQGMDAYSAPTESYPSPTNNKRLQLTCPGVNNFHEVSSGVYRGSQPTAQGFKNLKSLGIKTIIDCAPNHSDAKLINGLDFHYFHIPVTLWHLDADTTIEFLKIVTNANYCPVFIHCDNGSQKTGLMVAVYRMYVQGWTSYDATKELCNAGLKKCWGNIYTCLGSFNKEKIRASIKS